MVRYGPLLRGLIEGRRKYSGRFHLSWIFLLAAFTHKRRNRLRSSTLALSVKNGELHHWLRPMPRDKEEIWKLKGRIRELEEENEELKKKLDRARGVPAEVLVAQMTGGKRTEGYKHLHDVTTKKGNRIEVKLSGVSIVVQVTRIARGLAKRGQPFASAFSANMEETLIRPHRSQRKGHQLAHA